jgi:hypothetical protein
MVFAPNINGADYRAEVDDDIPLTGACTTPLDSGAKRSLPTVITPAAGRS